MQNISKQRAMSPAPLGGTSKLAGVPVPVKMSSTTTTDTRAGHQFKVTSGAFQVAAGSIPLRG